MLGALGRACGAGAGAAWLWGSLPLPHALGQLPQAAGARAGAACSLLLCKPCSTPPPPTCSGAFQTLSREKRDRCKRVLPQSCSRAAQILNLGVQHAAEPRSRSSVWVWLASQGFQKGSSALLWAGGVPGCGEPALVPVPRPLSQFPECPVDVLLEPGTPLLQQEEQGRSSELGITSSDVCLCSEHFPLPKQHLTSISLVFQQFLFGSKFPLCQGGRGQLLLLLSSPLRCLQAQFPWGFPPRVVPFTLHRLLSGWVTFPCRLLHQFNASQGLQSKAAWLPGRARACALPSFNASVPRFPLAVRRRCLP